MKKFLAAVIVLVSAAALAAGPKYVFLFIGDGMSVSQRMVAEEFARRTGLPAMAMNEMPYQTMTRTQSANEIITDSAAAATAIACGEKTNDGMLGVRPDGSRLESIAEVAKRCGRRVGIVTTVPIVHATPAGFYAHRSDRRQSYRIALDLVASGFDYFAGGGVYDKFDDVTDPEYRGNVFDLAARAGYIVCTNRLAWAALCPGTRSLNVFATKDMDFAIDADGSQPTLAEMVAKGIEMLDGPDGFFMMCEGGKIDYAGHANDAAASLREVLSLDDAVKVAVAFQERHRNETLIVTTGDHETGGLSMGLAGKGGVLRVELLARQKVSAEKFSSEIKELISRRVGKVSLDELKPLLTRRFGLVFDPSQRADPVFADEPDLRILRDALEKDMAFMFQGLKDTTAHDVKRRYVFAQAAKDILTARACIGWCSGSHTALPTLTTAKGPGADILVGMNENSELGARLKDLMLR